MGHRHYITFHPVDPSAQISCRSELAIRAQMIGLIGKADFYAKISISGIVSYEFGYRIDDYFNNFDGLHARLFFANPTEKPHAFAGVGSEEATCPICHQKQVDFWEILDRWWEQSIDEWICSECHTNQNIQALNWQHLVGFSRYGIQIIDSWNDEPKPILLDELADVFQTAFTYTTTHLH